MSKRRPFACSPLQPPHPMRQIPLCLLLLRAAAVPAQVVPTPLDLSAVSGWASALSAPSAQVSWAGVQGWTGSTYWNCKQVARTVNAGSSWELFEVPEPADLGVSQVFALNADTAWVSFTDLELFLPGGSLWKTTDGGSSWSSQFTDEFLENYLYGVVFYSPDSGVAIGAPDDAGYFEIQVTANGGATWERVASANIPDPIVNEASSFDMITARGRNIWFPTNKKRVFRSTDGGFTWSVSEVGIVTSFVLTEFSDASHGIAWRYPGGDPVHISNDGGATWTEQALDPPLSIVRAGAVPGVPGAFVFKAGGTMRLYATTDNFATWAQIDDTHLYMDSPIRMYDASVGWTCSSDPTTDMAAYRLDDMLSGMHDATVGIGISVFPNPVRSGAALITLDRNTDRATLRVQDAAGRAVAGLELQPGQRAVLLDVQGVAPGLYTLALVGNGTRASTRLVIQ